MFVINCINKFCNGGGGRWQEIVFFLIYLLSSTIKSWTTKKHCNQINRLIHEPCKIYHTNKIIEEYNE